MTDLESTPTTDPPTADGPSADAPIADAPIADAQREIRSFWDVDAATYDRSASHRPRSKAEEAAWAAVLARLLPPAPARVLDVGAGTGFLSLLAAGLGHRVTAHDLSPAMLGRLTEKAAEAGLAVTVSDGRAEAPPDGP